MIVEILAVLAAIALCAACLGLALRRMRPGRRFAASATFSVLIVLPVSFAVSRATWQLIGDTFSGVRTDEQVVALTFDDGPTRKWTGPVLEILSREGVRATFFLIGGSVDANPAEAKAIIDAGHEVGNHSYTHKRMVFRSLPFVRDEVERTDAALSRVGWRGPTPFRSPYCKKFLVLPYFLWRTGRTNVFWNVAVEGSPGTTADAARLAAETVTRVRGGSIILMHVMYDNRQVSRDALPLVIRGLRARGFGFVTVSELMRRRDASADVAAVQ